MRRRLAFVFAFSASSPAHTAEAEEEDDPNDDVRPVRHASIEVNPLGAAVDRYGGQLQVALIYALTLVGGASRVENASVQGGPLEVGSRVFFGLAPRRADGTRFSHVWLAASYLADDLHTGDQHGERRGIAFDAGVHARIAAGFYVLGGVGAAHRSTGLAIADRFEQMTTTPRLLLCRMGSMIRRHARRRHGSVERNR